MPVDDLNRLARSLLPLVQVTPRGVWGRRMAATHTTAEAWLGRPMATDPGPDELVRRYLTAFGPATTADLAAWSGLTGLRDCLTRLRPELRIYADERGRELLDVADGLLPSSDTPAPVRIIAEFDNLLLAHADRHRIFDDAHRRRIMTVNGIVRSSFLLDGFVAGTCTLTRTADSATLTCTPFEPLGRRSATELRAVGRRWLAFAAPELRPDIAIV